MGEILIAVLQAAALDFVQRCELGHELDAGFDAGEFSGGSFPGEEEAYEFLDATDFWRSQPDGDVHDWLCHEGDHDDCDGGLCCHADPIKLRVYRH